MKIMKIKKNTKNTKFSYVMHYRALIFIEKLQFSDKITKIMKNIKFSIEIPYRLAPLPEQFHCSIEELQFSRKIMKITDFTEKLQMNNFLSKQTPVQSISLKNYRFYHISLFQQFPRI